MNDFAASDQLPALLREPPWASGRRAPKPPRLDLPPLALLPRLTWSPEVRERALSGHEPYPWLSIEACLDEVGIRPEGRAAVLAGRPLQAQDFVEPPPSRHLYFDMLFILPEALSLNLWNDLPVSRWGMTFDGAVLKMLARHGQAATPGLLAYATQRPVQGLRVGRWLDCSELATIALRSLRTLKIARQVASDWLLGHSDTAAQVLLRQLFGTDDEAREDGRAALHALAAKGLRLALEQTARTLGPDAEAGLREQLDADPLLHLPARLPKLPTFFAPASLHRPRLQGSGAALPDDAMRHLALMLAISKPDQPYAGLDAVRAACTPASLAEFAWTLFEAWWAADAPSKEAWCFTSLAHVIDDGIAHRLGARAQRMAKEGAKNRAQTAVDMLADFGSDAALMHLNNLVERCKVPAVRNRAAAKVDAVAQARGLSRLELADRLVPTLGLDESRTLDFGPRGFEIAFDETLAPFVRDEQGALLKDLPKPRQSDDSAKAQAATLRWKQLKKNMKSLARVQIARLEQAMVDQRRWPVEDFRAFFVRHPLTRELAARVVWQVFDANGKPIGACRIAEDGTLANAQDDAYAPQANAHMGIAHPLALSSAALGDFKARFADYELMQPFPQLLREVHTLESSDAAATALKVFEGHDVATGAVIGLLDRGWLRGPAEDGGMINRIERPMGNGAITAVLSLIPGMFVGQLSGEPRQTMGVLALIGAENKPVQFIDADPIACSELLRDLYRLAPSALTKP
jgi:Domain of unknown function (DUF4132)